MIKKLIFLVGLVTILRATGLLPFDSSDVAALVPVQALVVSEQDGMVYLDGGDCRGVGTSWEAAWQDMQNGADGHVFFGTADHVVLCGEAAGLLQEVVNSEICRPAASICISDTVIPADQAAAYLSAHHGDVTLQQVRALQLRPGELELPRLTMTRGGLRLYE